MGASVGGADGSTDGAVLSDGNGDSVGQATATGSEPDGDGSANEGITPLGSAVGWAKQLGDGPGVPQPSPPTTGPHDWPNGWNAPL